MGYHVPVIDSFKTLTGSKSSPRAHSRPLVDLCSPRYLLSKAQSRAFQLPGPRIHTLSLRCCACQFPRFLNLETASTCHSPLYNVFYWVRCNLSRSFTLGSRLLPSFIVVHNHPTTYLCRPNSKRSRLRSHLCHRCHRLG